MSANECERYRISRDSFNAQADALEDSLPELEAEGINVDPIRRRIRRLREQAGDENRLYLDCLRRPLTNVSIVGIEETQAIQYWNILSGQGSGAGPANSIPLISQKATIIRIYTDVVYQQNRFPFPASLTGTLTVNTPQGPQTIHPANGPIRATSAATIRRTQRDDTLNFLIPWSWCTGVVNCQVSVFNPVQPNDSDSTNFDLHFVDVPPLAVHGVLVHYTGVDFFDNPVDAQPTGVDVLESLEFVLRTYPLSGFDFHGCEVFPWSAKLGETANFLALHAQLVSLRAMADTNDTYVALVPPAAGCGGICGYGSGGVALYFAGPDNTGASHEIGHTLGRAHTQCMNNAPGPDPNYPTYGTFPQGSIGEVGFDSKTLLPYDPQTTFDFMSYCEPPLRWVSPYTYLALKNVVAPQVLSAGGGAGPPSKASVWSAQRAEFYHLSFRLHKRSANPCIELRSAFHLSRRPPRVFSPTSARECESSTGVRVELLGDNDRVLDVSRCMAHDLHSFADASFMDYSADFPWLKEARSIRLVSEDSVLGTFQLSERPPVVKITEMKQASTKQKNLFRLSWSGKASKNAIPPLEYGVRFSNDGENWRALITGLTGTSFVFNLDLLPGGAKCRLQVVATAGLRTSIAETQFFKVPQKPRKVFLSSPQNDTEFSSGQPIHLSGAGFSPDFGLTRPEEVVWTSRTTGALGSGHQLTVANLAVGEHLITVFVPDGFGGEVSETVRIRISSKR